MAETRNRSTPRDRTPRIPSGILAGVITLLLFWITGSVCHARTIVVEPEPDGGLDALRLACRLAEPGDQIAVMSGVYHWQQHGDLFGPLLIENKTDISILGQGLVIFLPPETGDFPMVHISHSSYIEISNIHLAGPPLLQGCQAPRMSLDRSSHIRLNGMLLQGPARVLLEARETDTLLMEECVLSQATGSTFAMTGVTNFTIRESIICDSRMVCGGPVLDFSYSGGLNITKCLIASNEAPFARMDNVEDLSIRQNIFVSNAFSIDPAALEQGDNLEGGLGWFCTEDYLLDNLSFADHSALDPELRDSLDRLFPRGDAGPDVNHAAIRRLRFLKVMKDLFPQRFPEQPPRH